MMSNATEDNVRRGCDVLLAVDAYLPWSGGSRIYYDNLYRRLADQHGLHIVVETTHCSGDREHDESNRTRGLHIRRHGTRLPDWKVKRAPQLLNKMFGIASRCALGSPAAVHCGDLFPQDLAGMIVRRSMKLPLLVFVHGDEISQTEGRRLQPRVRNAIYRSADAIVAANSYAYERVATICDSTSRLTMITPGVDIQAFRPGERADWIVRKYHLGDSPVIVTVGRLVKKKGHETILRGLPELLKKVPELKYLVVGGGPEESRLKRMAEELGIAASVRFTGDVPHHSLPDFYRAGDVFCMVNQQDATGDIESFGMVFIEAGAAGKAVIGGRSGGTAQSILEGQTGFLCDPGDSTGLTQMLLLLLGNPELRHRLGNAGLDRARKEFDWDSRARQLFDVHRSITEPKPSRLHARQSC